MCDAMPSASWGFRGVGEAWDCEYFDPTGTPSQRYSRRMPSSRTTPQVRHRRDPPLAVEPTLKALSRRRVRHRGAFAAVSAGVHANTNAYMAASKHEQTKPTSSTLRSRANKSNPFVSDSLKPSAPELCFVSP